MWPLGPPGLLENIKDLICFLLKLKKIQGRILPDTPLGPPYTLQHHQDILRCLQTIPYHPWPTLDIAKYSPHHSQTFLTLNRHVMTNLCLQNLGLNHLKKCIFCLFGGFIEWKTSVYFCPLFIFFKTPLNLLTCSAVVQIGLGRPKTKFQS